MSNSFGVRHSSFVLGSSFVIRHLSLWPGWAPGFVREGQTDGSEKHPVLGSSGDSQPPRLRLGRDVALPSGHNNPPFDPLSVVCSQAEVNKEGTGGGSFRPSHRGMRFIRSERAKLTSRTLTSGTPARPPKGASWLSLSRSLISFRTTDSLAPIFSLQARATRWT
jgi:hypothetical protein